MIGNNSCGVHALMGGKTVDNIEALDILLYDGTRLTVGATEEAELEAIIAAGGRRGEIYAGLARIRDTYSDLIRQRFPKIPRRVSGYNLDELLPENGFNVARALVGSKGTCVTVLQSRCELKHSPQHRRLVVLGFGDPSSPPITCPQSSQYKPIGLEGFDGLMVDYMLRKQSSRRRRAAAARRPRLPAVRVWRRLGGRGRPDGGNFTQAALSFGKTCTVRRYSDG
jgi:FAD/FMN-containing dehydrogenase